MKKKFLGILIALGQVVCGTPDRSVEADAGLGKNPLFVLSTQPVSNAEGVSPDTRTHPIQITFSKAIERNSLNGDMFHLELESQDRFGTVTVDLKTNTAMLSLGVDLERGKKYAAVLHPGVRDLSGNRLHDMFRWWFRVAD